MIVHTEFRDGNVPAGYEQMRVLTEALAVLPEGVKKVRIRSDTAGYQHDLMKYCESGENKRFGRIEFAIGCDVIREFKKAVIQTPESEWKPLRKMVDGREVETRRERAEVCFVPNAVAGKKQGLEYRYPATREVLEEQKELPGLGQEKQYPFQTETMGSRRYKIFGAVTNMDWKGGEVLNWLCERRGKSEQAHGVMKEDLAGGKLPDNDFGGNGAWWWIMILSLNLDAAMRRLVLGGWCVNRRMKAMRFWLINISAMVIERSRELYLRAGKGVEWLMRLRVRIYAMAPG